MKRIENYRKGDRAEKLGVVLLQSFCAVAEIPRQEDFGFMDAVATLLRRDRGLLYAEDSFMVQFKSRTERLIEFSGAKYEVLLTQDLPLLIAQVDLQQSSIELHTLGVPLAHPNINDVKGISLYLKPDESCVLHLVDDVLHVPLRKPILRWTSRSTEDREFTDLAYAVLKEWATIERWNRRYRRSGVSQAVRWETNAVPSVGAELHMWNPTWGKNALDEMAPTARLLAMHATAYPELRLPARAIFEWLRKFGVQADPGGIHHLMLQMGDAQGRLKEALENNSDADVAVTFRVNEFREDFIDFWLFERGKNETEGGHGLSGSLAEIREKGFDATIDWARKSTTIGLSESWLQSHGLVHASPAIVSQPGDDRKGTEVILLRNGNEARSLPPAGDPLSHYFFHRRLS